jgi:hypothetical protein
MKNLIYGLTCGMLIFAACGGNQAPKQEEGAEPSSENKPVSDPTAYDPGRGYRKVR